MSVRDAHEADGEGYFASISDLMVGILFVFLLMLTVFALNLRESEDVSKRLFDEKVAQLEAANKKAEQAQAAAKKAQDEANDVRGKLKKAVTKLKEEVRNREEARDNLLKALSESLNSQGVKVTFTPHSDVLRLPEELLFENGQATLNGTKAQDALTKLSDSLSRELPCYASDPPPTLNCPPGESATLEGVLVEGHADHSGYSENGKKVSEEKSRERNDQLSVNRALTVFHGIEVHKSLSQLRNAGGFALLAVSAYGARRPVSNGETPEELQKNRRIDLRFLLSSRTSDDLKRLIEEIEPAMHQP